VSVIDSAIIPSAMSSRVLPFSEILNSVYGRKVPLSVSRIVDIILEIALGATLASYKMFIRIGISKFVYVQLKEKVDMMGNVPIGSLTL
jgi:hypothetical protein